VKLTLGQITAEVREVNIAHGWRPADGGPGENTWGDYIALLHSEIGEALEAYRDHRLADATKPICGRAAAGGEPCPEHGPSKPEGVGSEFADVLIRLVDMKAVFGLAAFDPDEPLSEVPPAAGPLFVLRSFGDHLTWLHFHVSQMWPSAVIEAPIVLSILVAIAQKYDIDLDAEYRRKIAYNYTRPYQHGGRTVAGEKEIKDA
jgi:NTP pyrophosphatase (non-canonical NTP hydrolase)